MPANSRWDLIQCLKVKIVKNPGKGHLNNLNDPDHPQCVNKHLYLCMIAIKSLSSSMYNYQIQNNSFTVPGLTELNNYNYSNTLTVVRYNKVPLLLTSPFSLFIPPR